MFGSYNQVILIALMVSQFKACFIFFWFYLDFVYSMELEKPRQQLEYQELGIM